MTETALPVLNEYAEYTAPEHRRNVLGIKQMLDKDTGFKEDLVTAPTRQKRKHDMYSTWDAHGSRKTK